VQEPHPPIHVGGVLPGGLNRAVRYGNGWIPIAGRGEFNPHGWIEDRNVACEKAGRDPAEVEISIYGAPTDLSQLEELMNAGINRVVFGLPPEGTEPVMSVLDSLTELKEKF
jgi:hypothetical protein